MPILKNEQNFTIQSRLMLQMNGVKSLIKQGFTVLKTQIHQGQPVIWIQATPNAAETLGGIPYRRKGGNHPECTYQAQHYGCRVQWTNQI